MTNVIKIMRRRRGPQLWGLTWGGTKCSPRLTPLASGPVTGVVI